MDPEALDAWLKQITEPVSGAFRNRQTGRRLRAMVPLHTFGHPCSMEALMKIARDYRLELVGCGGVLGEFLSRSAYWNPRTVWDPQFQREQNCYYRRRRAILTNDSELAQHAKHLTTTAKLPHRWNYVHDRVGYNYRMPNLNAALGCAQLEKLTEYLASKRVLFQRYSEAFRHISEIEIVKEPIGCKSNYWLQTLKLGKSVAGERDSILEATNDAGLMTRPVWKLLHSLKPFQDCPRAHLPVAESLERRLINLPSSAGLK